MALGSTVPTPGKLYSKQHLRMMLAPERKLMLSPGALITKVKRVINEYQLPVTWEEIKTRHELPICVSDALLKKFLGV